MASETNIHEMFKDISQFAKENPEHIFLWADNPNAFPPTIGVVAFLPNRRDYEDEQPQMWTITIADYRNTRHSLGAASHATIGDMVLGSMPSLVAQSADVLGHLDTAEGKAAFLVAIVENARKPFLEPPPPPDVKQSRFEMLTQDRDDFDD